MAFCPGTCLKTGSLSDEWGKACSAPSTEGSGFQRRGGLPKDPQGEKRCTRKQAASLIKALEDP